MGWKLKKVVHNNTFKVGDANIFDLTWNKTGEVVELKDVATNLRRNFEVCTVEVDDSEFRFAYCEIANGVYMIYVPDGA